MEVQDNNIVELNSSQETLDPRLLQKLQDNFTTEQQQLFVQSFVMYAHCKDKTIAIPKCHPKKLHIGFSTKQKAKELLTKNFDKNIHFTCIDGVINPQVKNPKGGRPTKTTLMTVETFKRLCMLENTDKTKAVRQYYITLEEVVQEYIYI
jgi:phage anti-repressor protein